MDAWREGLQREKQRQCLCESHASIRHADQNFFRRGEFSIDQNRRGGAGFSVRKIDFAFGESQVAGLSAVRGGETIQWNSSVPFDFAVQVAGDVSGGEGHRQMTNGRERSSPGLARYGSSLTLNSRAAE